MKNTPGMRPAGICEVYPANAGCAANRIAQRISIYASQSGFCALHLSIFEQPPKGLVFILRHSLYCLGIEMKNYILRPHHILLLDR